jgi:hypothetical protein
MRARWLSTVRIERKSRSAIGVAVRDQPEHIDLSLGEIVRRTHGTLGGDPDPHRRAQVALPGGGSPHRRDELLISGLLQHITQGTRTESLAGEAGSCCIVSTTICVPGNSSRIAGIASRLDPPGMFRSSTRTPGW